MNQNPLPRNRKLRPHSTELRINATKQENHLWYDFLRDYPVHFYRQRIIGDYIVDFYCPRALLVLEIDGSQHYQGDAPEYDSIRTAYLETLELTVMRFTNQDVDARFVRVCEEIDRFVQNAAGA